MKNKPKRLLKKIKIITFGFAIHIQICKQSPLVTCKAGRILEQGAGELVFKFVIPKIQTIHIIRYLQTYSLVARLKLVLLAI